MFKTYRRLIIFLFSFPLFLALSACNDSKDDQTVSQPDTSKKPVMRCAP